MSEITPFEYKNFVYSFQRGAWATVGQGAYSEAGARLEFWHMSQSDILPELQKELDEGWEPLSEVGPGGIALRSFRAFNYSAFGWIMIFLGILATWGLLLFVLPFMRSTCVEPVEFKLSMRRRKR